MRRRGFHRDAMNGGFGALKCAAGGSGAARRCWMAAGGGLFAAPCPGATCRTVESINIGLIQLEKFGGRPHAKI